MNITGLIQKKIFGSKGVTLHVSIVYEMGGGGIPASLSSVSNPLTRKMCYRASKFIPCIFGVFKNNI